MSSDNALPVNFEKLRRLPEMSVHMRLRADRDKQHLTPYSSRHSIQPTVHRWAYSPNSLFRCEGHFLEVHMGSLRQVHDRKPTDAFDVL